ncbi:lipopolysaccharide biosynthesis protein [Curtobacterium sp. 1310]|uniref:lipopolysaccharide biosynthesis protein n=1 Tax=Curtobacterium sp. 1310 TaxID=2806570 RepID=UPI001AE976E9|nr:hypothetical protein [Curtobacterium sp. 1310]MBP1301315.1 O-antigen/teichoic acid export membrane protein [Curtobacterium sp. 1310]
MINIDRIAMIRRGESLRSFGRRFTGFISSTAITAGAGVVSLPLLIAGLGADSWSAVAVAQSIGAVGAIVVGLGWAVTGPTEIAQLRESGRRAYLRESLRVRGIAAVLVGASCVSIQLIRDGGSIDLALISLASALAGLGGQWYYYGSADARGLLVADTLPRAAALLLGAASALFTHEPLSFAAFQILGALIPVAFLVIKVRRSKRDGYTVDVEFQKTQWKQQVAGTVTALSGSIYLTLPVALMAISAPSAVASFALADRLARVARLVVSPMTQTLQGWVSGAGASETRRREKIAFVISAVWGTLVALCFTIGAAMFAGIVSGGQIRLTWVLAALIGATLVATSVSQTTGTIGLILRGRGVWLAVSAVVGGLVACPLLLILPRYLGAEGGAMAVLVAETAVLLVQCIALIRPENRGARA